MKSKNIFLLLIPVVSVLCSCSKNDSLPSAPVQTKPDTIVQTTPPAPVEAIYIPNWQSIYTWNIQRDGDRNIFVGSINNTQLTQNIIDSGLAPVYLQDSRYNTFINIPDNGAEGSKYVEYDNNLFTSVREEGVIKVAVISLNGSNSTSVFSSFFQFRYFLIPKSRLNQGLDYKDYKAVCNYYKISQ